MPRINAEITVQVAQETSFEEVLFERAFTQVIDSLVRAESGLYMLAAGELNTPVDFGDVAQARMIYIEADGELEVTFGGVPGTVATLLGAGASFPTGFAGGEAFSFKVDGVAVAGTFLIGDQTLQQVVNRLNATAMLAGIAFVPFVVEGGQIRMSGAVASLTGKVEVLTANATIGFPSVTSDLGTDPILGVAPMQLQRPIDLSASSAETLKAYLFATVKTTNVLLSNNSASQVTARVMIAGDFTV